MATDHNEPKQTPLENLGYATDEPSPRVAAVTAAFILGFLVIAALVVSAFLTVPGIMPDIPHPTTPFARQHPPAGVAIVQNAITNTTDIRDLRQHEDAVLATYGKSDGGPQGQTYRLPIDDALNIVASQGSLGPTENWLANSSKEVPGDLSKTTSGPNAGGGPTGIPAQTTPNSPATQPATESVPTASSPAQAAGAAQAPVSQGAKANSTKSASKLPKGKATKAGAPHLQKPGGAG